MPYDPGLAYRLQEILEGKPNLIEKKMFGGIGWMLNGNMCVGVYREWLIIRVGESIGKTIFSLPNVKPMDITGKPMKGWAMVSPEGLEDEEDLRRFVKMAIEFVGQMTPK